MKKRLFALVSVMTCLSTHADVPTMDIQFGGALAKQCDFVNNSDVVSSLQTTIQNLENIQEVEVACQNILINSKAFMQSSLNNALELQTALTTSKNNEAVISSYIKDIIATGNAYDGSYDSELLTAQKEISLLNDKKYKKQIKVSETMQLGITLFNDLQNSPAVCSHAFGQELLAPAIAVTGRVFGVADPGVGLVANLLSSIIGYGSRIMEGSYESLQELTAAKNFHMNYKCTMKNIEDILCDLEEEEEAILSAQSNSGNDTDLDEYIDQILSYDNDNSDFRKFHHIKRHRYRISKIIEDLDNIYRSPETAKDLETVVSFQTAFTGLSLLPKQSPVKGKAYVEAMVDAGLAERGELDSNWDEWDNNETSWKTWTYNFRTAIFSDLIDSGCRKIDVVANPLLKGIYLPNEGGCNYSSIQNANVKTEFYKVVIVPALVFVKVEAKRIDQKIKENANIHALYNNINNQPQNLGNADFKDYSLSKLIKLYGDHAKKNEDTSLKLYAQDVQAIVSAIDPLINTEQSFINTYDEFVEATKKAYSAIAKVSNNGVEGGILYRSIVESKISSYIEGISKNYIFHKDEKVAQNFVNFNFHAEHLDEINRNNENQASAGSSNLSLMLSVKSAFLDTFSETIAKTMDSIIKDYKYNKFLKRGLVHSCAIFLPQMEDGFRGSSRRTTRIQKFCKKLLIAEDGLALSSNAPDKFPLNIENGPSFGQRCYYKEYEEEAVRFKINKAKRNRGRFRI